MSNNILENFKKNNNMLIKENDLLDNDVEEYDLLINVSSELTKHQDIMTFLFFMKFNKQSLPNYDKLLNIIKNNKNIDKEEINHILMQ